MSFKLFQNNLVSVSFYHFNLMLRYEEKHNSSRLYSVDLSLRLV